MPDDRGDPFRRGAADEFRVEGVDVGAVVGVAVRHDGRGSSPAWHLATLDVRNDATGEVATFACEDWISADAPGGLERTLTPAKKPPDSAKAAAAAFKYRVDVVTGSRMGSGTDAKVSIAIDAEGLDSPWAFDFGEQREQYFSSGAVDTFVASRATELGEIRGVRLACANDGVFGDSWFCERVSVFALAKGTEWVFHCGDWVGSEGKVLVDGILASASVADEAARAEAALRAAEAGGEEGDRGWPGEYRMTFYTGGETGAGTDAAVFAELVDVDGASSGALAMDRAAEYFDAKSVDAFDRVVDAPLRELKEVVVWHDGSGAGMLGAMQSSWNLDKVVVTRVATEREWVGKLDDWIYGGEEKAAKKAKRSKPVPPDYTCMACQNRHSPAHWIYDCPEKERRPGSNHVKKKLRGLNQPSSCKVFVSGLPFEIKSREVEKYFATSCGKVVHCKLLTFEDTKRCKGQAFVTFEEEESAKKALKMTGEVLDYEPEDGGKKKKK